MAESLLSMADGWLCTTTTTFPKVPGSADPSLKLVLDVLRAAAFFIHRCLTWQMSLQGRSDTLQDQVGVLGRWLRLHKSTRAGTRASRLEPVRILGSASAEKYGDT